MAGAVNITATFKKDTVFLNGLESIHDDLIARRAETFLIVAEVRVKEIVDDVDAGTRNPRVKLRHIEPMLDEGARDKARELLDDAFKARTGRDPEPELPFGDADDEQDPTAGPWPGDRDYPTDRDNGDPDAPLNGSK